MTPSAPAWSGLFEKTPDHHRRPGADEREEHDDRRRRERVAPADAEGEGREQRR